MNSWFFFFFGGGCLSHPLSGISWLIWLQLNLFWCYRLFWDWAVMILEFRIPLCLYWCHHLSNYYLSSVFFCISFIGVFLGQYYVSSPTMTLSYFLIYGKLTGPYIHFYAWLYCFWTLFLSMYSGGYLKFLKNFKWIFTGISLNLHTKLELIEISEVHGISSHLL